MINSTLGFILLVNSNVFFFGISKEPNETAEYILSVICHITMFRSKETFQPRNVKKNCYDKKLSLEFD